jgi:hypothetical protein
LQAAFENLQPNNDLVLIPPPPDNISDEEEGNEEDLNNQELPEVSISLLSAKRKLLIILFYFAFQDVPGLVEVEIIDVDQEEEMHANGNPGRRWKKVPLETHFPSEIGINANMKKMDMRGTLQGSTPLHVFERIIDDEVIQHFVDQTKVYAAGVHNDHNFDVSPDDIRTFLAILLFSGYHELPSERHYWSIADDLGIPLVKESMTRDRYLKIKRYFHLADNSHLPSNDRAFKVRPLITMLNDRFHRWGVFDQNIAVDESMVGYFGNSSLKQFIRGKPTRFGYKLWSLCGESGFCYSFDLYCGRSGAAARQQPLGPTVVFSLVDSLPAFQPNSHILYFDNFFCSLPLLSTLADKGIRSIGTINRNRVEKCPLKSDRSLINSGRGSFDYRVDVNKAVAVVKWNDNSLVHVATNFSSPHQTCVVRRWNRAQRVREEVQQPLPISLYSSSMGGVDLNNKLTSSYRIRMRGKKWYWPLVTYFLDMATSNSWVLYRLAGGDLTHLDYRRELVNIYFGRVRGNMIPRVPRVQPPPGGLRFDGLNHWIQKRDQQRHCQAPNCSGRPRTYCLKCNVTLCVECFAPYHMH